MHRYIGVYHIVCASFFFLLYIYFGIIDLGGIGCTRCAYFHVPVVAGSVVELRAGRDVLCSVEDARLLTPAASLFPFTTFRTVLPPPPLPLPSFICDFASCIQIRTSGAA